MHPRWRPDQPGASIVSRNPSERSSSGVRQSYINEPLPDLEQQLAAQLEGVSWAVVAFAPEDSAWCDWVYRNLNGYPLPTSLVDRVTSHGFPRPDCLSIFPDRRDPSYPERAGRALEDGTYLIVVCSAASAQSSTVDAQIRTFKADGGEERVLALVVDGPPDAKLGERRRAAQCEWLPTWLRWRLEEEGFRVADRSEPRVIDARRGYRSLKQVRDSLLAALTETDVAELERLGGCSQNVELGLPAETPPAERKVEVTTAVFPAPAESAPRRGSKFTIVMAVMLTLIAAVFGTRSFLEITAEEPASTLEVSPVTGMMPGHSAKVASSEEAGPLVQETPSPLPEVTPVASVPAIEQSTPPSTEPAAPASTPTASTNEPASHEVKPVAQVTPQDVPPVAPTIDGPTSRILPPGGRAMPEPGPGPVITARTATFSFNAPPSGASNSESDAVLLDEVRTLERRGDETMSERRTEDALDLYHTALSSAEEYAARKGANPAARDQVVALMRKLGTLQMQNSSTAEARATYIQARKMLLQIKSQGGWTRERAKALDEIESRLLSLPRD
ncbi:MAG TPA: hypothetical protein VK961_14385 [Chthoniobacter sp.]|nr:hypothetical protein [Chthoniobacter sp.]